MSLTSPDLNHIIATNSKMAPLHTLVLEGYMNNEGCLLFSG